MLSKFRVGIFVLNYGDACHDFRFPDQELKDKIHTISAGFLTLVVHGNAGSEILLRPAAALAFVQMQIAAEMDGVSLNPVSGNYFFLNPKP